VPPRTAVAPGSPTPDRIAHPRLLPRRPLRPARWRPWRDAIMDCLAEHSGDRHWDHAEPGYRIS
jgi:hypothetical protein